MGRPREFEPEEALLKVMDVFWAHGFESASMQVLEAATGLKKQSLYRVFGDKRAMYLEAIAAYDREHIAELAASLRAPGPPADRIARLLDRPRAAAETGDRRGCFLCNASIDQSPHDPEVAIAVRDALERLQRDLSQALMTSEPWRGRPEAAQARARRALSDYFGLNVMLCSGAGPTELAAVADDMLGDLRAQAA